MAVRKPVILVGQTAVKLHHQFAIKYELPSFSLIVVAFAAAQP